MLGRCRAGISKRVESNTRARSIEPFPENCQLVKKRYRNGELFDTICSLRHNKRIVLKWLYTYKFFLPQVPYSLRNTCTVQWTDMHYRTTSNENCQSWTMNSYLPAIRKPVTTARTTTTATTVHVMTTTLTSPGCGAESVKAVVGDVSIDTRDWELITPQV